MSNTEDESKVDINKFLEVRSKELDLRSKEIENRNLESHNNKEIRIHEIDKSVEIEKIEKEKMQIFFDEDEKSASRKFVLTLMGIIIGIALLGFSCYLLFFNHKYGITLFFSTLSFVAGIFSGIGIIKASDRETPNE
jgi:hypothetical protein